MMVEDQSKQIIAEWYEDIENLRQLAAYIQDKDGATALDTAEFLEKPWKWKEDWDEMLEASYNFQKDMREQELNV